MRLRTLLIGLGYAAGAIALALLVIFPVFYVVNLLYDQGRGLTPLLVAIVAAWITFALLLARRRIRL